MDTEYSCYSLRLPKETLAEIKIRAIREGLSMKALILESLRKAYGLKVEDTEAPKKARKPKKGAAKKSPTTKEGTAPKVLLETKTVPFGEKLEQAKVRTQQISADDVDAII